MDVLFKECTDKPGEFFNILPSDWQEDIIPHWGCYRDTTRIFILKSAEEVLGGGMVFSSVSPDTLAYREEAKRWFDKGYLYIGFLWIAEGQRDKKLGSKWLEFLFNAFPGQKFWLSIEDYGLTGFYIRNGFQLIRKVNLDDREEWILAREAE